MATLGTMVDTWLNSHGFISAEKLYLLCGLVVAISEVTWKEEAHRPVQVKRLLDAHMEMAPLLAGLIVMARAEPGELYDESGRS